MKLCMPKQHGAWAMLVIPFWLGVAATRFIWVHIPFFIGWLLLYLATYPILLLFKKRKMPYYTKWAIIYFIPAMAFLLVALMYRPSIIYFGFIMIPFFALNAYFSSQNKERTFTNDFIAILIFAIGGLASAYLAEGTINSEARLSFSLVILFFIGTTFYVKSIIRERKNTTFKWFSWIYHTLIIAGWVITGNWLIAVAFIPSLIRAIYFYGKRVNIKTLGILEFVNASFFFIIILLVIM
ncbi:YwiC-like family protein [Virgibacillus sp. LDC-1]|uniref:YwiC-like family protein n=1 Tax=Virgibacillus sp. LDC-1 TaxID=3039856 RepID=UPI0024DDFA94|nr:YwiC-like family protein [Virgibacillus sp. LDC-1]